MTPVEREYEWIAAMVARDIKRRRREKVPWLWNIGVFLAAIVAVMWLSGCVKEPPQPPDGVKIYEVGWYYVYEIRLADGTRCVSVYNGGLACEWRNQ